MNKIYENVFIGNFIFSLGVLSGLRYFKRNLIPPMSINLFQQTPADKYIGDVFASMGGKNYIIEFKAANHFDAKELAKHSLLVTRLGGDFRMLEISTAAHFFASGSVSEVGEATLEFRSYVQAPYLYAQEITLDNFCSGILDGKISENNMPWNIGASGAEISDYLELLKEIHEGDRRSSTGGLIVNVSPDGKISYLSTKNIFELTLTLEQFNANLEQQAQEYNPSTPEFSPSSFDM